VIILAVVETKPLLLAKKNIPINLIEAFDSK
jgi:hypothetical protein